MIKSERLSERFLMLINSVLNQLNDCMGCLKLGNTVCTVKKNPVKKTVNLWQQSLQTESA